MSAPARALEGFRPAFFLGVTGKIALTGYADEEGREKEAVKELRTRVRHVLDWLVKKKGAMDPGQGRFDEGWTPPLVPGTDEPAEWWAAHGLEHTPIVVLSSLAPGADTVVAEAALDYAREHGAAVSVRAPLPFPLEVYRRSSSFRPADAPGSWTAKAARLERLLKRLRSQPGWNEERDLFAVELAEAVDGDPEADLNALDRGRARRHLRYRAAGEFIAAASHVLLALYDETQETAGDAGDLYAAGTLEIVESKRRGHGFGLLAFARGFSGAILGSVLRLPIDLESHGDEPCRRALALLQPFDTRPKAAEGAPVAEDDPRWQVLGDRLLRGSLVRLEEFNALGAHPKEADALARLLEPDVPDKDLPEFRIDLPGRARLHAEALNELARVRRRASERAGATDRERRRLLIWLVWLIFGAALALGAYEHWPKEPDSALWLVEHPVGRMQAGLLLATLALLFVIARRYWGYRRGPAERQRFDLRAVGEGLRVQFYWSLAGVRASAAAEYLQRQRSELSWIRDVVAGLAFPSERALGRFTRLDRDERAACLQAVRVAWVRGQRHYADGKGRENEKKHHFWQLAGWSLAAAGLLNVIGKCVAELCPKAEHALHAHPLAITLALALAGLVLLVVHAWRARCRRQLPCPPEESDEPSRWFYRYLLDRPALWGWALLAGSLAFALPFVLALVPFPWPDWHAWWIILTGALLLGGGLSLAWNERNFYAEHARLYRSLANLYASADLRLASALARYRALDPTSPESARALAEIHAILFALGREALAENAEWLIQHRARPLEPFLAG
jgi:hypothetical protein